MHLIICDDHPIVVLATSMLVEAHGHEVVATTTRPPCLPELVAEHRPDACIVDLHYEDETDAHLVLPVIRSIARSTDVVVVTGSAGPVECKAALAAGAVATASKSLPSSELLALIEGRSGGGEAGEEDERPPALLTRRELQVLQCLVEGDATARIASRLHLQPPTVRSHVQSIMGKLGTHTRSSTVVVGLRMGLGSISA